MYGSGPDKVAETVTEFNKEQAEEQGLDSYEVFTVDDAKDAIRKYFKAYPRLKKWLDQQKQFIQENGYIYQFFGRKRRLPNVFSSDRGVAAGEVRSGINACVQGPSSDVNLLGAMDMHDYIKTSKLDAEIFALVHDSILAIVSDEDLEEYCEKLTHFIQKDRGLTIPGCPIGVDIEIGQDYSFGGIEEQYPEIASIQ